MSSIVQRATTEQQRPTSSGAFYVEGMERSIKHSLETLPENHSYRIHGTQHVDIVGLTFNIIRVDPTCEWCRASFKLEV